VAVGTGARRGLDALASALRTIGLLIVGVLVAHIALTLLGANPDVWLVALVRDLADAFDLGLAALFRPADPELAVAVNHGTAALIWLVLTSVVVRLVRRIG